MWSLNVTVVCLDTDSDMILSILYIAFPSYLVVVYFVYVFVDTFYWFWHQTWTLFWYAVLMIITGLVLNIAVNKVLWIYGLCLLGLAAAVPFLANEYLKRKTAYLVHK